jgi:hypothetical protein
MHRFPPSLSQVLRRTCALLFTLSLCGIGLYAVGCSSEEPEEDMCRKDCPRNEGLDLMTPRVSFAAEISPVFARSCSQQLCHGNPAGPRAELYLGPATGTTEADLDGVHGGLLRASKTAPVMPLVTPGFPQQSFLLAKIEGCQNKLHLTCNSEANTCNEMCGDGMPPPPNTLYPPLSSQERLAIRRWIAQGAPR